MNELSGFDASDGCAMSSCVATGTAIICDSMGQAFIIQSEHDQLIHKESSLYNDAITAVALNSTGTECVMACKKIVNIHSFPEVNSIIFSHVHRDELDVTQLQFDGSDANIFISSKAKGIKVFSRAARRVVLSIDTFDIGVRSFRLSPCGGLLTAVNETGTVLTYTLNRAAADGAYVSYNLDYQISGAISRSISAANDVVCSVSWHPSTKHVAVPHKTGSAVLQALQPGGGWSEHHLVCPPAPDLSHNSDDVAACLFSLDGSHLVTADATGRLLLWAVHALDADPVRLLRSSDEGVCLAMEWGASRGGNHSLLVLSTAGWKALAIPEAAHVAKEVFTEPDVVENVLEATQMDTQETDDAGHVRLKRRGAQTADDDDDDVSLDNDAARGVTALEEGTESVKRIREEVLRDRYSGVDEAAKDMDDQQDDDDGGDDDGQQLAAYSSYASPVELQPSFQPSCTAQDDYQRRYLVWNDVGSITSRDEGQSNRIEIRFSNVNGINKQQAFSDPVKYSLASMSPEGAFFATELPEIDAANTDPQPGSSIYYRGFPGHKEMEGANGEFSMTLLNDEGALAVAVGKGWCAVTTTRNYLRIFSSTGLQLAIFCVNGPVVTVVGLGNRLAVIYHRTAPLDETPQLETQVYELSLEGKSRLYAQASIAITPRSSLTWAGFSESGVLHFMDSSGTLFGLLNIASWQSIPLLETSMAKKSVDHVFWPVFVRSDKLFYVLLNGESKPAVYPQPITTSKSFHIPILESEVGKEKDTLHANIRCFTQESMRRCHLDAEKELVTVTGLVPDGLQIDEYETKCEALYAEADKAALKMLIDSCRLQRLEMAADIAKKLVLDRSIEAGIIAANHYGRTPIARLLSDILDFKQSTREQQLPQDPEMFNHVKHIETNSYEEQEPYYENSENFTATVVQQGHTLFRSKSIASQNPIVSPQPDEQPGAKIPINPFARVTGQTPVKRKSAMDSIKELKGSPSPKKPLIARESPFAQSARTKSKTQKEI